MVRSCSFLLGGEFQAYAYVGRVKFCKGEFTLEDEEDHILWRFSSSGQYSVQSLYAIINHRGVVPMFV